MHPFPGSERDLNSLETSSIHGVNQEKFLESDGGLIISIFQVHDRIINVDLRNS